MWAEALKCRTHDQAGGAVWLQHGAAEGPTEDTTEKEAEFTAGVPQSEAGPAAGVRLFFREGGGHRGLSERSNVA